MDVKPGAAPILCVQQAGQQTCPTGKPAGRTFGSGGNAITVCCGGR
jgi:hypothetical protein